MYGYGKRKVFFSAQAEKVACNCQMPATAYWQILGKALYQAHE